MRKRLVSLWKSVSHLDYVRWAGLSSFALSRSLPKRWRNKLTSRRAYLRAAWEAISWHAEALEPRLLMAATLYWDTNGSADGLGGTGSWDTSSPNWTLDLSGKSPTQVWIPGSDAIFKGTAGTVTVNPGSTPLSANSLTLSQGFKLQNGTLSLASGSIIVETNATATLSSILTGAGGLTKTGSGTLVMAAANTYTGLTTVSAGTLKATVSNAINSDLTVGGGSVTAQFTSSIDNPLANGTSRLVTVLANGILTLSAHQHVQTLTVASGGVANLGYFYPQYVQLNGGTINGGSFYWEYPQKFISSTTASTQTVTTICKMNPSYDMTFDIARGSASVDVDYQGAIANNGNTTNKFLSKTSLGVLELSSPTGSNYTVGATDVKQGTLLVANQSGSATGTGPVKVEIGATFGGSGTVSGAVTVYSGGVLAPGLDSGTTGVLGVGNLTLASGSTVNLDLHSDTVGTGYDQLRVTGTVNLCGATLNLAGTTFNAGGGSLVLLDNDGADPVVGTFANLPEGTPVMLNGIPYHMTYRGGDGNDVVLTSLTPSNLVAVAEAASYINLSWSSSDPAVTGFILERAGNATFTHDAQWLQITLSDPAARSYTDFRLADNTTYYYRIRALSANGQSGNSNMAYASTQGVASLLLTPDGVTLAPNSSLTFKALAVDSGNQALTTQPSISWAVTGGGGAIDTSGRYTAPAINTVATITATVGSVNHSVTVHVVSGVTPMVSLGVFNTGVDGSGTLLGNGAGDSHWTIVNRPTADPGSGQAYATDDNPVDGLAAGLPPWLLNNVTSRWISPEPRYSDPHHTPDTGGIYSFQTQINLTGFDPSTASLWGTMAADNQVNEILLNDQPLGISSIPGNAYSSMTAWKISSGNPNFVDGINTLTFVVQNLSGAWTYNPCGFRAEIAGMAARANHAPIVTLTGPATGPLDTSMTLAATVTDPDGDAIQQVALYCDNNPTPIGYGVYDAASNTWQFATNTGGSVGSHTWRAVATDCYGLSGSGNWSITISLERENQAPIVTISGPATGTVGIPLTLTAQVYDPDADPIQSVTFYLGHSTTPIGDGVYDTVSRTWQFTWTPEPGNEGTCVFAASATDKFFGAKGWSTNALTIHVTSAVSNQPPTVTLAGPATGMVGTAINLSATVSDPDGDAIQTVAFYLDGSTTPAGHGVYDAVSGTWQYAWTPPVGSEGSHSWTACATDNQGLSGPQSTAISLAIASSLSVSLTGDTSYALTGIPTTLTSIAYASSSSLPADRVEFLVDSVVDSNVPVVQTGNSWGFAWTPTAGTHTLIARATYGTLVQDSTPLVMQVYDAPPVTLTVPNAYVAGQKITLTAQATDPALFATAIEEMKFYVYDSVADSYVYIDVSASHNTTNETWSITWTVPASPAISYQFKAQALRVTHSGGAMLSGSLSAAVESKAFYIDSIPDQTFRNNSKAPAPVTAPTAVWGVGDFILMGKQDEIRKPGGSPLYELTPQGQYVTQSALSKIYTQFNTLKFDKYGNLFFIWDEDHEGDSIYPYASTIGRITPDGKLSNITCDRFFYPLSFDVDASGFLYVAAMTPATEVGYLPSYSIFKIDQSGHMLATYQLPILGPMDLEDPHPEEYPIQITDVAISTDQHSLFYRSWGPYLGQEYVSCIDFNTGIVNSQWLNLNEKVAQYTDDYYSPDHPENPRLYTPSVSWGSALSAGQMLMLPDGGFVTTVDMTLTTPIVGQEPTSLRRYWIRCAANGSIVKIYYDLSNEINELKLGDNAKPFYISQDDGTPLWFLPQFMMFSANGLDSFWVATEDWQQDIWGTAHVRADIDSGKVLQTVHFTLPDEVADVATILGYTEKETLNTGVVYNIPLQIQAVAQQAKSYSYTVHAFDPTGGPLSYELIGDAHGATIDTVTGKMSWIPTATGTYWFAIAATAMNNGLCATQKFKVVVTPEVLDPTPPQFTTTDVLSDGRIGRSYTTKITATSPGGNRLTYSLGNHPKGMAIDPDTGILTWASPWLDPAYAVTINSKDYEEFEVIIEDEANNKIVQAFYIALLDSEPANQAELGDLSITATPDANNSQTWHLAAQLDYHGEAGKMVMYKWQVIPPNDDISLTYDSQQSTVGVDANAAATATADVSKVGSYLILVTASDGLHSTSRVTRITVEAVVHGLAITSPGNVITGTSRQLTVNATDQFGKPIISQKIEGIRWSVTNSTGGPAWGSIDPFSGIYTAPETLNDTEIAYDQIHATYTDSSVTISPSTITIWSIANAPSFTEPTEGVISPTSIWLQTSVSYDRGESNLLYTWWATWQDDNDPTIIYDSLSWTGEPCVVFDTRNGTNAGKDMVATFKAEGSYEFHVKVAPIAHPTEYTECIHVLRADLSRDLAAVSILPDGEYTDGIQHFVVQALDQYGRVFPATSVQWTTSLGSITSDGYLSPGSTSGEATITATVTANVVQRIGTDPSQWPTLTRILTTSTTFSVSSPHAPLAWIGQPIANADLHTPADIIGTATDGSTANGFAYTLEYAPYDRKDDETAYQNFASGSDRIVNGKLGTLDTTRLANGLYQIRLTVTSGGNTQVTTCTVNVTGELKVGNFTFSEVDVPATVSGLPFDIARTYDSLNRGTTDDAGYGWHFNFDLTLQESSSTRQKLTTSSFDDALCQGDNDDEMDVRKGGSRDVFVTLPDGRRTKYIFDPGFTTPGSGAIVTARFDPEDPSVHATLKILPGFDQINTGSGMQAPYWVANPRQRGDFASDLLNMYDIPGYILTMEDGSQYFFEKTEDDATRLKGGHFVDPPGSTTTESNDWGVFINHTYSEAPRLTKIIDAHGNIVVVGAIEKANDTGSIKTQLLEYQVGEGTPIAQILVLRDATNRITSINSLKASDIDDDHPNGQPLVVYRYDALGNLAQVSRLVSGSTAAGTAQWVAAIYDYALSHALTALYAPQSVATADTVPSTISALITNTYYPDGRLETSTDAQGHVVHYGEVQAASRVETVTDRRGIATEYHYDDEGNVFLTINLVTGEATRSTYQPGTHYKLSEVSGTVTVQVVGGQRTAMPSSFVATAPTHTYTYDAMGYQTSDSYTVNGLALTTNSVYIDVAGQHLLKSSTTATGITTTNSYDFYGNITLTTVTDAAGHLSQKTVFEAYDSQGHARFTTQYINKNDQAGDHWYKYQKTDTTYDPQRGFVTETKTYAYAHDVDMSHSDGAGDLVLLQKTTYNVDPVTGNILSTTQWSPDASGTWVSYATTSSTYDRLNRVTSTTDAAGRLSRTFYTASGQTDFTMDFRDGVTAYTYNDLGQEEQVITFHLDNPGQYTTESDLIDAVHDQVKNATRSSANLTLQETFYDAENHVRLTIDALGNRTESYYDPAGRLIQTRTFDGTSLNLIYSTETIYDAAGRVSYTTDRHLFDSAASSFTVTATHTVYNVAGQVTQTERCSNLVLELTSTGVFGEGSLVTTLTILNTDQNPIVTLGGSVSQTHYDAYGRVDYTLSATGLKTTYEYDAAGRQQAVVQQGVPVGNSTGTTTNQDLRTEYDLDGLGRQVGVRHVAIALSGGASIKTLLDYTTTTYDALGCIIRVVQWSTEVKAVYPADLGSYIFNQDKPNEKWYPAVVTYTTYDNLGRKVAQTSPLAVDETRPAEDYTTNYEYDVAGNLTAVTLPSVVIANPGGSGTIAVRPRYEYAYNAYGDQIATCTNAYLTSDGNFVVYLKKDAFNHDVIAATRPLTQPLVALGLVAVPAALAPGATFQFEAFDQFGRVITPEMATMAWSCTGEGGSTITANGLFTAGSTNIPSTGLTVGLTQTLYGDQIQTHAAALTNTDALIRILPAASHLVDLAHLPAAVLDLNGLDVRITASSLIEVTTALRQHAAYNSAIPDPTHIAPAYAIAIVSGADYHALYGSDATFNGQSVADSDVLLKSTYPGDANLDGEITMDDYLAAYFGQVVDLNGYTNGDFNYDVIVGDDDIALMDISFTYQNPTGSTATVNFNALWFGTTDGNPAMAGPRVPVLPPSLSQVTAYSFDAFGRQNGRLLPGDVTGESTSFDQYGRSTFHTDFKGQVTENIYSDDARVTGSEHSMLGRLVYQRYSGNGTTEEIHYTYDTLGRQETVTDTKGTTVTQTTYGYDADNHVTSLDTKITVDGQTNGQHLRYAYDPATGAHTRTWVLADSNNGLGNATTTRNEDTEYTYDLLGRLQTVTAWTLGQQDHTQAPLITTYTYTASGSLDTVTLPNHVVTDYNYDSQNRLIDERQFLSVDTDNDSRTPNDITNIAQYTYTLLSDGNRSSVLEISYKDTGAVDSADLLVWSYDHVNRLTQETRNSVDVNSLSNETLTLTGVKYSNTYAYDLTGNRLQKTHLDADSSKNETITYTYNAKDQLLAEDSTDNSHDTTYTYDPNGSTLTKSVDGQTIRYGYDLRNKLVELDANNDGDTTDPDDAIYLYDAQGNRISKSERTATGVETTLLLVDNDNPTGYSQVLEELTPGGVIKVSYLLGQDVIGQAKPAPATDILSYLLYDGHGSTRALVDATGQVIQRYAYDAYGIQLTGIGLSSAESALTSLLYSGEQFDAKLAMQYLRARYYNPILGRFLTSDEYIGQNTDPLSLHKYLYAGSQPISHTDPTGMMSFGEQLTTVSIIGGLVGTIMGGAYIGAGGNPVKGVIYGALMTTSIIVGFTEQRLGQVIIAGMMQGAVNATIKYIEHRLFKTSYDGYSQTVRDFIEGASTGAASSAFGRWIGNKYGMDPAIGAGIASAFVSMSKSIANLFNDNTADTTFSYVLAEMLTNAAKSFAISYFINKGIPEILVKNASYELEQIINTAIRNGISAVSSGVAGDALKAGLKALLVPDQVPA